MESVRIGECAPLPPINRLQAAPGEALTGQAIQVGLPAATLVLLETLHGSRVVRKKRIPYLAPHLKIFL